MRKIVPFLAVIGFIGGWFLVAYTVISKDYSLYSNVSLCWALAAGIGVVHAFHELKDG